MALAAASTFVLPPTQCSIAPDTEAIPRTLAEFDSVVARNPHSRNVLCGPVWVVDQLIVARDAVLRQLVAEQTNWVPDSEYDVPTHSQVDAVAAAHPDWFAQRMTDALGPSIGSGLSDAEVHARAELYAHRAAHRRWNSGYELVRFRCSHVVGIQAFVNYYCLYMRVAYYRAFTPAQQEIANRAAHKSLNKPDESAMYD
jgi:hypothetical protein